MSNSNNAFALIHQVVIQNQLKNVLKTKKNNLQLLVSELNRCTISPLILTDLVTMTDLNFKYLKLRGDQQFFQYEG